MTKRQSKKVKLEEVLTPIETNVVVEEQKVVTPTFVVTRGGVRVSDAEYQTDNDPAAIAEADFWKRIITRHPDGTKIEIVLFDKKKHKIW